MAAQRQGNDAELQRSAHNAIDLCSTVHFFSTVGNGRAHRDISPRSRDMNAHSRGRHLARRKEAADASDNSLLLFDRQFWEDGKAQYLGRRSLGFDQTSWLAVDVPETLLLMQRDGIVDFAGDTLLGKMRSQCVSARVGNANRELVPDMCSIRIVGW